MGKQYFEDFSEGDVIRTRGQTITESAIIDFASKYDPLPFHLNAEEAEDSLFEGLVASGLHTLVLCNRMVAEHFYQDAKIMGGPGLEKVEMTRPVRPGDTISVEIVIDEKIPSESEPDRGLVKVRQTCYNQDNEVVLETISLPFFKRRKSE